MQPVAESAVLDADRVHVGRDKEDTEIQFIEDDQRCIVYFPSSQTVRMAPRLTMAPPPLMSLRPDQVWYRGGMNGRPWIEMLGPHPNFPQQNILSYTFTRVGPDRIQMERKRKNAESRFRVVASLPDDGNVVEHESHYRDEKVEQTQHDVYRWARDAKGRCYLASVEFGQHYLQKGKPDRGVGYTRMTIDRIDLDAKPDPSLFEIASLNLPPGTHVDDDIAHRRYRIGDAPVAKIADSLDGLTQEAASRGFARRGR